MDFGALPPEINSGRMYLGPGSGPLRSAAAAWDALSAELFTAAHGYASIVAELAANAWLGPASVAMTAAVTPFVAWLADTADNAAEVAGQARTAAAAFELAFAMTVPPPAIAANRSLLLTLVATNFFGQNAVAIAAAEAHYAQMWLQDATAMYLYAESSSLASALPPFHRPPGAADPAGPAALPVETVLSSPLVQILEHVPNVTNSVLSSANAVTSGRGSYAVNMRLAALQAPDPVSFRLDSRPAVPLRVSVAWGRAGLVGRLSAPPSWFSAAPELRPAGSTVPGPVLGAAPADPAGCGSVFGQSALGTLSRDGPAPTRAKSKPIIVRSPAAG